MKTEPLVYSIDDLKRDKVTSWEGVRNYAARNNMQAMSVGDQVLIYHSNAAPPGVAGVAKVAKAAYPDHFAWNKKSRHFDEKSPEEKPRWFMVDVKFVKKLAKPVGLDEIKSTAALKEMVLVKQGRLSVQPVTKKEFDKILNMGVAGGG
ncbi:MAG: EVE domain-containing protein [Gemmatimonadota bacterium]|nr:EVE domain-containing protein [Gemmatimonadota bacterium]